MEIKIQCHCGTKYKFEFEPVDGRVPFTVNCPNCGVDATDFANSRVQDSLASAAPLAVASAEPAPAPEPRLRVRLHSPAASAATAESTDAAAAHAPPRPPAPRFISPPGVTPYAPTDEGLSPRFFMGLLGALVGVALGCGIWYLVFHFTGSQIRLLALLVGAGAGFGAKIFSKDEGSAQLGIITAVFVFLGIAFTGYTIGRDKAHSLISGFSSEIHQEMKEYAKGALAAVPNGTEEEIRLFLAKEEALDDETPDPKAIDEREVRLFRDVRMKQYQDLVDGKVREKDFLTTQLRWDFEEDVADAKYTLAAMPNETDSEIRLYLAREYAEPGKRPDPRTITTEDIAQFRADVLPELKALANGEKTFDASEHFDLEKSLDEVETEHAGWMRFIYFFSGWGLGGIAIMFGTLGLAYKICANA